MRLKRLGAVVLVLTIILPGAGSKNFTLDIGSAVVSVAQAQMFKAEPAENESDNRAPTTIAPTRWQRVSALVWEASETVKHQGPNLMMSLSLAAMILILVCFRLRYLRRRDSEEEPLCKCGSPHSHCPWCSQGES